ncbi:MAG: CsbD family protein [Xanthobacteraceae bacterium]
MGSTTDKIKGTVNEGAGKVKQRIGEAVDSPKLQSEGALQEAKGDGQQAIGDAKEAMKKSADKAAEFVHRKL